MIDLVVRGRNTEREAGILRSLVFQPLELETWPEFLSRMAQALRADDNYRHLEDDRKARTYHAMVLVCLGSFAVLGLLGREI